MSNPNKSLIARLVSDHADSLAVKLRDWPTLEASLDKNYEATTDEKGNVVILRKQTRQLIDQPFEQFFKLVARPHTTDLSWGKFRSQFQPRETTNAEKSMTKALLDHSRMYFTDQAKREKVEGFIMANFIPDGSALRRLHKGQVSSNSYEPDQILMQYASEIISPERSELQRLEVEAEIFDRATWLSRGNEVTAKRLAETMKKIATPSFNPLPNDLLQRQDEDNTAYAMATLGILSKSEATLQEMNAIDIRKKQLRAEIDMLPVLPND